MHTKILRKMLIQEARVFLKPSPMLRWRRVQVLIPPGTPVLIGVDTEANDVGPDRVYKLPPFPSGATHKFRLFPDQFLCGAVDQGNSAITVIVEYMELLTEEEVKQLRPIKDVEEAIDESQDITEIVYTGMEI